MILRRFSQSLKEQNWTGIWIELVLLVDGSAWKTLLASYQASQVWQWVTSDSTYQEMRSGGELGLSRARACAMRCPSEFHRRTQGPQRHPEERVVPGRCVADRAGG